MKKRCSRVQPRRRPSGSAVESDRVPYNLAQRGIEHELLPGAATAGVAIMAYSPTDEGRLLEHLAVKAVAARHGTSPAQVAIAWVLRQPGVNAIRKAGKPAHVRENRAALDLHFGQGRPCDARTGVFHAGDAGAAAAPGGQPPRGPAGFHRGSS
jgi:aryl-alcohol dehydrogenase-like predicted oxidoreductase